MLLHKKPEVRLNEGRANPRTFQNSTVIPLDNGLFSRSIFSSPSFPATHGSTSAPVCGHVHALLCGQRITSVSRGLLSPFPSAQVVVIPNCFIGRCRRAISSALELLFASMRTSLCLTLRRVRTIGRSGVGSIHGPKLASLALSSLSTSTSFSRNHFTKIPITWGR